MATDRCEQLMTLADQKYGPCTQIAYQRGVMGDRRWVVSWQNHHQHWGTQSSTLAASAPTLSEALQKVIDASDVYSGANCTYKCPMWRPQDE